MQRPVLLCLLAMAALGLGACGTDDVPSGSDAAASARAIAEQARALQKEITATARELVDDPAARAKAEQRLRDQEDRARTLAERAKDELPEEEAARADLIAANERAADAAADLRAYADTNRDASLEKARDALQSGSEQLRDASEQLLSSAPESARKALEDARERLPSIPRP
ncbi:MAG: hypothetical protein ACRDMZ_02215 [Solirubrobacteraceae bacterium]